MDAAGEVIAAALDVTDLAVGDTVFGMTNRFAGGVHAEITAFRRDEVCRSPRNLSPEEAACVPLAAQTALQALRDCCRIQAGQRVLINGASGGVGHFAVQIARILGAEAHAVCGPDNRSFVESLGAHAVYTYTDHPATGIETPFDAVFDVFGNYARPAFARQLGSRGVYVSTVPKPATIWAETLARTGISTSGRLVAVRSCASDLNQIRIWIEDGRMMPRLDQVYPVSRAADAHRHVESRHTAGKVCIRFPN
jgi:NADPH:quinone reductase-like Zn-dependent oxidoreductase